MFICYNWIGMVADMHLDKDAAFYEEHGVSKLYDEKSSTFYMPGATTPEDPQKVFRSLAEWGSH